MALINVIERAMPLFFCSSKPFVLFSIVGYKQILIIKILKLKLNLKSWCRKTQYHKITVNIKKHFREMQLEKIKI
ncbi:hypothetical protein [Borreliella garinii]|uniref:hypothetical protein n=1 Tax=Borreliella garinii TaxID=29519 RepID=UPI001AEEA88E|nr:hypothetical protein [Borreliella garinii]